MLYWVNSFLSHIRIVADWMYYVYFYLIFFYLLMRERERERRREREKQKHWLVALPIHKLTGWFLFTLTRDGTHNLGVSGWHCNPLRCPARAVFCWFYRFNKMETCSNECPITQRLYSPETKEINTDCIILPTVESLSFLTPF